MIVMKLDNYADVDEITKDLSIKDLIVTAKDGTLISWLKDNFYENEAYNLQYVIDNYNDNIITDEMLFLEIANTLQVDTNKLSSMEKEMLLAGIKQKRQQEYFYKFTSDKHNCIYVKCQSELIAAVKRIRSQKRDNVKPTMIYLCDGEYKLSLHMQNIHFVGIDNPVINIDTSSLDNLREVNIILENLTVFYKGEDANISGDDNEFLRNVKIIVTRKYNNKDVFLEKDILHRNHFISKQEFIKQCESISPIVVGDILLNADDYNIETEIFSVLPKFDVTLYDIIYLVTENTKFYFKVTPNEAKELWEKQRKLEVFAEFTASIDGDHLQVKSLYVYTAIGKFYLDGRRIIQSDICSSSGGLGGYGIKLIKVKR